MASHRPDPLDWIDDGLAALRSQQLGRHRRTLVGSQGPSAVIDDRGQLNFGSNDYLSLAADPRLAGAVADALSQHGWGAGASPLVVGHSDLHQRLEIELARFEGTEAALLLSSGYAANVGAITALVGSGDAVFSDANNHASIVDGCRLSRATIKIYPHGDVTTLERLLHGASTTGRRLIVTDGLFSMDGDRAPLHALAELAEQFDCMLMVDEAHATGVFGDRGRGVSEDCGVEDRVTVRVGTLSKALGCAGGFVVGPHKLIEWLINRSRNYIFSTAHPAAGCAAALRALKIVREEPVRRDTLLAKAQTLRGRLGQLGWDVHGSQSHIIPLRTGTPERALDLAARLQQRGIFIPPIRPPSVALGHSLLRLSLCYGHTDAMIDRLVEALSQCAAG